VWADADFDLALPVTLIDFRAEMTTTRIVLTWQTEGFLVWRKVDQGAWENRTPQPIPGQNSTRGATYQWEDVIPRGAQTVRFQLHLLEATGKTVLLDSLVIHRNAANLPAAFYLFPAFPNPFNGATTLRWALPRRANVRVVVYNALGEQVAVLVDDTQSAGVHYYRWLPQALPSGRYFIALQIPGTYYQTIGVTLLR